MTNSEEFKFNFGKRLKAFRKTTGLNQTDFSAKVGIARDTLSRYERGEISPSVEVLASIVSTLGPGVSADYLLFEKPESTTCNNLLKNFKSLVGLGESRENLRAKLGDSAFSAGNAWIEFNRNNQEYRWNGFDSWSDRYLEAVKALYQLAEEIPPLAKGCTS